MELSLKGPLLFATAVVEFGDKVRAKSVLVGGQNSDPESPHFIDQVFQLNKGDIIYMFSDGYPDQFGGPQGKKFKYRPFKDLLLEVHERPMEEQHKILNLIFDEWKGDLSQIDDVLVIGLRL